MIQAVPIQEGSLDLILHALQDRYGDIEDQSLRLLKEVRERHYCPPRNHTELKDWYYRLKIIRQALRIQVESAEHSLFMLHVLESLPTSVHRAISDHFVHSGIKPTIDDILARLDTTIRSQELFDLSRKSEAVDPHFRPTQPPRQLCAFCSRTHQSKDCRTVPLIVERQNLLRSKGLCLRCLTSNHDASQCRAPCCSHCQGSHHVAVCHQQLSSTPQPHYPNPSVANRAFAPKQSTFSNHLQPYPNRSPLGFSQPTNFYPANPNRSSRPSTFPDNLQVGPKPAESFPIPSTTNPPKTTPPLQMKPIGLLDHENTMSPQVRVANVPDPIKAFIDTGSDATFVDVDLCHRGKYDLGPPSPRDILSVGGGRHSLITHKTSIALLNQARKPVSLQALAVRDLHTFFTGTAPSPGQKRIQIVLGQDSLPELDIQRTHYITPDGHRVMDSSFGRFVVSHHTADLSNPTSLFKKALVRPQSTSPQDQDSLDRPPPPIPKAPPDLEIPSLIAPDPPRSSELHTIPRSSDLSLPPALCPSPHDHDPGPPIPRPSPRGRQPLPDQTRSPRRIFYCHPRMIFKSRKRPKFGRIRLSPCCLVLPPAKKAEIPAECPPKGDHELWEAQPDAALVTEETEPPDRPHRVRLKPWKRCLVQLGLHSWNASLKYHVPSHRPRRFYPKFKEPGRRSSNNSTTGRPEELGMLATTPINSLSPPV